MGIGQLVQWEGMLDCPCAKKKCSLLFYAREKETTKEKTQTEMLIQTYTTNEDNGFETFTQDSDEGEDEQGIATRAVAQTAFSLIVHSLGEFTLPLFLDLGCSQHGHTHNRDHDDGQERERTFPNTFTAGPQVVSVLVPEGDGPRNDVW